MERLRQLPTDLDGLNSSLTELTGWFIQVEAALNAPLTIAYCSQEAVETRKTEHQQLEKSIEEKSSIVSSVLNLCESFTSSNTLLHGWLGTDVEAAQSAMEILERRWNNICQRAADRQLQLQYVWEEWSSILAINTDVNAFLDAIEKTVPRNVVTTTTVELEKLDAHLEVTMQQLHAPSIRQKLDHVNEKYCHLAKDGRVDAAGDLQQVVSRVNTRWRDISDRLSSLLHRAREISSFINHWHVREHIDSIVLYSLHMCLLDFYRLAFSGVT